MLMKVVWFETVAALIIVGLLPAALSADDVKTGQTVLDANAAAGLELLEGPPGVLRVQGDRRIGRNAERSKLRTIKPAATPEAPWYTNGFVALSAVLMLIGAVGWGFKRFAARSRLGGSAIQLLSKTYLSSKQSLALVKVSNRVMLIGITPDHIAHLTTIDDPAGVDLATANVESTGLPGEQFDRFLEAESTFYRPDDNIEEHVSDAEFRTVRETRRNLRGLLGKVKALKDAART